MWLAELECLTLAGLGLVLFEFAESLLYLSQGRDMRIAFFEDSAAAGFAPIALTRPVFELVCGHFSLRERLIRRLSVHDWGAFIRPELVETFRESNSEAHVNDFTWLAEEPTLLINARWLPSQTGIQELANVTEDIVGRIGDTIAFVKLEPFESALLAEGEFDDPMQQLSGTRRSVAADGHLVTRPWDLVDLNPELLVQDFAQRAKSGGKANLGQVAVLGKPEHVYVDPSAEIDPFVVIDARGGPVYIDAGARVQAFTRLEGPVFVGRDSQLFRANVKAGTTIGPVCRIGGEIESSIIHGYANKYHDGFLGHSYVCPWVNLGALTTNSDLKNNYSEVRVPLTGTPISTGSTKIGSFIGDHTKTALCSLFNTGSSIGVMTMLLPGGELLPRNIPSFTRVWHGVIDDQLDLDESIETARYAMGRRNQELTPAEERLLRHLYRKSQPEREAAVERFESKRTTLRLVR